jgi:hypothetical protein
MIYSDWEGGREMYINIKMLLIWILISFVYSTFSSIKKNENMFEFINRFTFISFFDGVTFLVLSYFKVIR